MGLDFPENNLTSYEYDTVVLFINHYPIIGDSASSSSSSNRTRRTHKSKKV